MPLHEHISAKGFKKDLVNNEDIKRPMFYFCLSLLPSFSGVLTTTLKDWHCTKVPRSDKGAGVYRLPCGPWRHWLRQYWHSLKKAAGESRCTKVGHSVNWCFTINVLQRIIQTTERTRTEREQAIYFVCKIVGLPAACSGITYRSHAHGSNV